MLRSCSVVVAITLFLAGLTAVQAEQRCLATLRTGESLEGALLKINEEGIALASSAFTEPLTIGFDRVASVEVASAAAADSSPWVVRLKSGSEIAGELKGLNDRQLIVESPRLGRIEIARSALAEIRRAEGESSLLSADLSKWRFTQPHADEPSNLVGQPAPPSTASAKEEASAPWKFDQLGRLAGKQRGAMAFRAWQPETSGELTITLSSKDPLEFMLGFGAEREQAPYLTYAGGSLMLMTSEGIDFAEASPGPDNELTLVIVWDGEQQKLWVKNEAGDELLAANVVRFSNSKGVAIVNQRDDLRIDRLLLRPLHESHDESQPSRDEPQKVADRAYLTDGSILVGKLKRATSDECEFESKDAPSDQPLTLDRLNRLVLASEKPSADAASTEKTLGWANGERLRFDELSAADAAIVVSSSELLHPLRIPVGSIELLLSGPVQPPTSGVARLRSGDMELTGEFVWGDASSPLRWKLSGASAAGVNLSRRVVVTCPPSGSRTALGDDAADLIHFANGDILPGALLEMTPANVKLKTPFAAEVDVAAEEVSAIDFQTTASSKRAKFTNESRVRLLEVPRYAQEIPFTHALVGRNGDLLRGRLERVNGKTIEFDSRLDPMLISREHVAALVVLPPPPGDETTGSSSNDEQSDAAAEPSSQEQQALSPSSLITLRLHGGYALTGQFAEEREGTLHLKSPLLGTCRIPESLIESVHVHDPTAADDLSPYRSWAPVNATQPRWGDEETPPPADAQALLGSTPTDFSVTLHDGRPFRLAEHRGQQVVLIFWTTWSSPSVRAIEDTLEALGSHDGEDVTFVAVNQGETASQVAEFLKERQWENLQVALDVEGKLTKQFSVSSYPQAVVIDAAGKIRDIQVGYRRNFAAIVQEVELPPGLEKAR